MEKEKVLKTVEEILEPILEAKGLVLVDIEYKGLGSRSILSVYIDGKERPVTLKECEDVSGLLSLELDAHDVIDHSYVLEVSSPGLDRVLKKDRELRWAVGKKVRIFFIDGREERGRLEGFDNTEIVINEAGTKKSIEREKVRKIKLDEV